jgi:hypothetical protein
MFSTVNKNGACLLPAIETVKELQNQRPDLARNNEDYQTLLELKEEELALAKAALSVCEANLSEREHELALAKAALSVCEANLSEREHELVTANAALVDYEHYVDHLGVVVQYRQAYFELKGEVADAAALPSAHAWPEPDHGIRGVPYEQKLARLLPIADGIGAEIGPLSIPIVSRQSGNILYVDHLDTKSIKEKYPSLEGIVDVDRPMVNNNIGDTLLSDAPLDYLVASQVFEHVPNPIRWLQEVASVLSTGGLFALSLPDRRMTFDFLREETTAADIVAAYFADATIPDVRCTYDHYSLASFVNMPWASADSISPAEIVAGRGAVRPRIVASDKCIYFVEQAKAGQYLDVHAWVFTPVSFLLVMAQLATHEFLPFRLRQFYPTNVDSHDRGNSSFTVVLEKVASDVPAAAIRQTFLEPLGP